MPCDSVSIAEIELGKADPVLLEAALATLNIQQGAYQYSQATGILTLRGRTAAATEVAEVKRAYSRQIVMSQAKKYGWQVRETKQNTFEVLRR